MSGRRIGFWVLAVFGVLVGSARPVVTTPPQELLEGRTIEQWIEAWSSASDLHSQDVATSVLARAGEVAVPALREVLERRGPDLVHAFETVARMGPAARPLLPAVIAILRDRDLRIEVGEGARRYSITRAALVAELRHGPWMADALVPVLGEIVLDPTEDRSLRLRAIDRLGGFDGGLGPLLELVRDVSRPRDDREAAIRATKEQHGAEKQTLLTELVRQSDVEVALRLAAMNALSSEGEAAIGLLESLEGLDPELDRARHDALASAYETEGGRSTQDYFTALLHEQPLVDLRARLGRTRREVDRVHVLDPDLVRFLWTELERALEEESTKERPSPDLPLEAAYFVQDVLQWTELHYRKGNADGQWANLRGPLALPELGHRTIARLVETAYSRVEPGTTAAYDLALDLARTNLLLGDWAAMNHWLEAAGRSPIAEERRGRLTAPPGEWTSFSSPWQDCPEELRSGSASFTLPVTREGRPVRGAHVRLKSVPPPRRTGVFSSGVRIDYLAYNTQALPTRFERSTFAYYARDVDRTRYVVTDDSGIARFENLPKGHYEVEMLLPVANLEHAVTGGWELWIGTPGGPWSLPTYDPDPVFLDEGQDYVHPTLDARPQFRLSLGPWQEVPLQGFELSWTPVENADRSVVHWAVSSPQGQFDPEIDAEETEITEAKVRIGGSSGPLRPLAPGNVYQVQIRVLSAGGEVLARSDLVPCFVAWNHRPTLPPSLSRKSPTDSFQEGPPISDRNWYLGTYSDSEHGVETNRQRLDRYLLGAEDDFEYPYARVVRAWYHWLDGEEDTARSILGVMTQTLPEGNVARETAVWLRRAMDEGTVPQKELRFRPRSQD